MWWWQFLDMYWYIDLPEKKARDTRICANLEVEIFGIFLYLIIVDSKKKISLCI